MARRNGRGEELGPAEFDDRSYDERQLAPKRFPMKTDTAIVQRVFDFAIREINILEERIVTAEDDADAMLWAQAEKVVEQLEAGLSTRELAAQWINPRNDGKSYSAMHVSRTAQVYRVNFNLQPRPRFRDAYNELANPKPHVAQSTGNNEWYTPREYIEAARTVLGRIDLDPASSPEANRIVDAARYYTIDDDGLAQPWSGRVWLNPPYAHPAVEQFANKLAASVADKVVAAAVVLVNNATETEWFRTMATHAAAVCFPDGRVRFWSPDRDAAAPLQGQAVLYIGPDVDRFVQAFSGFGVVWKRDE
jgi:phage N-6-adenine-methyltransferase